MLRRLPFKSRQQTLWLVTALALVLAVAATTIRLDETYTVEAVTEILTLTPRPSESWSTWDITDALMFSGDNGQPQPVSGLLSPASGVEVIVERISHGPISLTLIALSDESAGKFLDLITRQELSLRNRVVIKLVASELADRVRSGRASVFPFEGDARVGDDSPGAAILRSGTVTTRGHSIVGRTLYEGATVELDPGDQFLVQATTSAGFGQIVVNEGPALTVVFHVVGSQGKVNSFGTAGYEVRSSFLDRILNDGVVQGTWSAFVFLIVIARRAGLHEEESK